MILQKLWVSQNFSRISRVSQSRFLYEGVKHFEVSVSQSKKSKCLRLAKKNAGLAKSCIYHSPPLYIYVYIYDNDM